MKQVDIVMLPIDKLVEHPENPNFMLDGQFNKLNQNIEEVGMVENLQVAKNSDGTFTVIGGHHRMRAAKLQGYQELPCVILEDLEEGKDKWEDKRRFQLLRMNIIRGKIDPLKFTDMFNQLEDKYEREVLREMFGFWDERSFNTVYKQIKDALPPELQKELEKSKKEIKTIEDLARILNKMFNEYGSTLDYGFMWFSYGGQEHFMLQMDNRLYKICKKIQEVCETKKTSANDILAEIIKNGSIEIMKDEEK